MQTAPSGDIKRISKISVKTKDEKGAGSVDAIQGMICGSNGKCCNFELKAKSLVDYGNLVLETDQLGGCKDFSIGKTLMFIELEKFGHDTWVGDFVDVEYSLTSKSNTFVKERCPIQEPIRTYAKASLECSIQKEGMTTLK